MRLPGLIRTACSIRSGVGSIPRKGASLPQTFHPPRAVVPSARPTNSALRLWFLLGCGASGRRRLERGVRLNELSQKTSEETRERIGGPLGGGQQVRQNRRFLP